MLLIFSIFLKISFDLVSCEKSLTTICCYILCLFICHIHLKHYCIHLLPLLCTIIFEIGIVHHLRHDFFCSAFEDFKLHPLYFRNCYTSCQLFRFICCVENHALEYLMILMWFHFVFCTCYCTPMKMFPFQLHQMHIRINPTTITTVLMAIH